MAVIMRFYLISDNVDTLVGMRLAGVGGTIAHESREVMDALFEAIENKDIAVVLITEKLMNLCGSFIYDLKLNRNQPLIVAIPDRHVTTEFTDHISEYIESAIGVKI